MAAIMLCGGLLLQFRWRRLWRERHLGRGIGVPFHLGFGSERAGLAPFRDRHPGLALGVGRELLAIHGDRCALDGIAYVADDEGDGSTVFGNQLGG